MKNRHPEKRKRKRVGRGTGSGHGKTSCRGGKGQTARSGGKVRPGFEGGQNPFYRRLPKRGFNNAEFTHRYQAVNVADFEKIPTADITPEVMVKEGLSKRDFPIKILATGEVKKAYRVKAHKFSESAKKKIEAAGGTAEVVKIS
jgi:large subunit ribosomal protein L15